LERVQDTRQLALKEGLVEAAQPLSLGTELLNKLVLQTLQHGTELCLELLQMFDDSAPAGVTVFPQRCKVFHLAPAVVSHLLVASRAWISPSPCATDGTVWIEELAHLVIPRNQNVVVAWLEKEINLRS
jgi:hypothetical protein